MNPKGANATGREFNGECDPVKPAADPGEDRRIDITQHGAIAARHGPFHEKLGSGIAERFHGSQAGILRVDNQVNTIGGHVLPSTREGFAAGRQDVRRMGASLTDAFGQRRHIADHDAQLSSYR